MNGLNKNDKRVSTNLVETLFLSGWGTRIRTLIDGVRVRSLAIRPFPRIVHY